MRRRSATRHFRRCNGLCGTYAEMALAMRRRGAAHQFRKCATVYADLCGKSFWLCAVEVALAEASIVNNPVGDVFVCYAPSRRHASRLQSGTTLSMDILFGYAASRRRSSPPLLPANVNNPPPPACRGACVSDKNMTSIDSIR